MSHRVRGSVGPRTSYRLMRVFVGRLRISAKLSCGECVARSRDPVRRWAGRSQDLLWSGPWASYRIMDGECRPSSCRDGVLSQRRVCRSSEPESRLRRSVFIS